MAENNIKKFLDQQGVTTLWSKITAKIAADVKVEKDRAELAEQGLANSISALDTRVGALPEGTTAANVVEYIDKKTADIASGEAMTQLTNRVTQAEKDIDAIEADYLTSTDYAALEKAVTDEAARADAAEKVNAAAIKAVADDYLKAADKTELQGNIDGVDGRVAIIEGDYLKAADKTELQGKIDLKADASALAQEVTDRTNAVSGLQNQINLIMNNPDTDKVVDSITEFTAWVEEHGEIAEGMRQDISDNAQAIVDEAARAAGVEEGLANRIKAIEDADHDFGAADAALKTEIMTEVNKKADQTAMETALAGKASTGDLADVKAIAEAAATKTYVDEELAKKATVDALNGVKATAEAAAVKTEVEAALALKANQADLEAEAAARAAAVKANSDAIAAIKDHASVDSFADVVAEIAKKQDIIPANTYDVHGAADQALVDAKAYTDTEFAKIQSLSTVDIENAIAAATTA